MFTFHYLICNVPKKEKYHVIKLIFMNNKLENNDELYFNTNQLDNLKNSIDKSQYTTIYESTVNLDSFLKHINLLR